MRKGEVYLSNDKAERKASGSYYTPDPIVEYIVSQTVGLVLDQKLEGLRADFRRVRKTFDNEVQKATAYPPQGASSKDKEAIQCFCVEKTYATYKELVERMFDLKVLDPAMGSGHFLVEAVDFITDRLLKFLNAFPINPISFALERTRNSILESLGEQRVTVDPAKVTDINLLERYVLKGCIYGVDLNPMAVELAKVSLRNPSWNRSSSVVHPWPFSCPVQLTETDGDSILLFHIPKLLSASTKAFTGQGLRTGVVSSSS